MYAVKDIKKRKILCVSQEDGVGRLLKRLLSDQHQGAVMLTRRGEDALDLLCTDSDVIYLTIMVGSALGGLHYLDFIQAMRRDVDHPMDAMLLLDANEEETEAAFYASMMGAKMLRADYAVALPTDKDTLHKKVAASLRKTHLIRTALDA